MSNIAYVEKRKSFYNRHKNFFADFEEAGLEYGLYGVKTFPREVVNEINYATEELWKVFKKVKEYIKGVSYEEFVKLGYSGDMYELIQSDYVDNDTVVSRFDFIVKDGQIKMIELNNDTPFLLMETFYMNHFMCDELEIEPTHILNDFGLTSSYISGIIDCAVYIGFQGSLDKLNIVVACQDYEVDKEEYLTVGFIYNLLEPHFKNISFVDIATLRVVSEDENGYERGLYTEDMRKIDVLIRPAHPIEFLLDDVSEDGERIGLEILKMVGERRLAMLNPPSSYILQSKVTMALLCGLYNLGYFNEHERNIIEKYLLKTSLRNKVFVNNKIDYVEKPVLSREGQSVRIFKNGEKITSTQNLYDNVKMIYQEYFEMPSDKVVINGEEVEKKYLIGSFIVNNRANGLACRYGNDITEWESHWMAVGIE